MVLLALLGSYATIEPNKTTRLDYCQIEPVNFYA